MKCGLTVIELLITPKCNQRCSYCLYRDTVIKDLSKPEMSIGMIRNILTMFTGAVRVRLSGGEPLMHPKFGEVISTIRGMGLPVVIVTNGTRIVSTWEDVDWKNISTVNVSISDSDEQEYHRITGTNRLSDVQDGLSLLSSRGDSGTVVVSFTMHRGNVGRAAEFVRFAKENNAERVVLQSLIPHVVPGEGEVEGDEFWSSALLVEDEETVEILNQQRGEVERLLGRGKATEFVRWPYLIDRSVRGPGCSMASKYIMIDGAGDVSLCCRGKGPRPEMGNIAEGRRVYVNPQMKELRRRVYDPQNKPAKCLACYANYSGVH